MIWTKARLWSCVMAWACCFCFSFCAEACMTVVVLTPGVLDAIFVPAVCWTAPVKMTRAICLMGP